MKRLVIAFALVLLPVMAAAQELIKLEQQILVNDQKIFTPGYAMGDLFLPDPKVADIKVLPGRKEVIIYGKTPGRTRLTIQDQKRVPRHELELIVVSREAMQLENDLRELLKPYPTVQLRTLGGKLVVSGDVETKADKEAVDRIAGAASVQSLVRYKPSGVEEPRGMPGADRPAGGEAVPKTTARAAIEYEMELMEASVSFGSGVYGTGVEPSGRPLAKKRVTIPINEEGEIYFNEPQLIPKDFQGKKNLPEIGIRLRVRPGPADDSGNFTTYLLIETNVPVSEGSFADPTIQRRARWEFRSMSGTPVGVGGNELLAIADVRRGPSTGSRLLGLARVAGSVPGAGGIGTGVGIGSGAVSAATYDRSKKTQLMMILRPRTASAPQQ